MAIERIYRATATYANGTSARRTFRSYESAVYWAARRERGYPADPIPPDDERPAIPPAASVVIEVSAPIQWSGSQIQLDQHRSGWYRYLKGERVVELWRSRKGRWRLLVDGKIHSVGSHQDMLVRAQDQVEG